MAWMTAQIGLSACHAGGSPLTFALFFTLTGPGHSSELDGRLWRRNRWKGVALPYTSSTEVERRTPSVGSFLRRRSWMSGQAGWGSTSSRLVVGSMRASRHHRSGPDFRRSSRRSESSLRYHYLQTHHVLHVQFVLPHPIDLFPHELCRRKPGRHSNLTKEPAVGIEDVPVA